MKRWLLFVACAGFASVPVQAEEKSKPVEDPAHAQLRALKQEVTDAWNKRDLDRLLGFLTKDVVVTWQNGEVSVGRDKVREYYNRMLSGPNSVVESVHIDLDVAELSHLYGGDTAIAWGSLNDRYKLRDGMDITMNSRWSATLVKEGDRWLIANYHASANLFDNEVLHVAVKKTTYWSGGIGLLVGLVLGGGLGIFFGRRK